MVTQYPKSLVYFLQHLLQYTEKMRGEFKGTFDGGHMNCYSCLGNI